MTISSPGRASSAIVATAADPEANAMPKAPPSSSATARSSRSRVGFWVLAYSYPPRGRPTPSWAYVEVW